MGASDARAFLEKLQSDEAYRADVDQAITATGETLGDVAKRASRDGFNFTPEDLGAAMAAAGMTQLNDAELDSVAGGFNPQPTPPAMQNINNGLRNLLRGRTRHRF